VCVVPLQVKLRLVSVGSLTMLLKHRRSVRFVAVDTAVMPSSCHSGRMNFFSLLVTCDMFRYQFANELDVPILSHDRSFTRFYHHVITARYKNPPSKPHASRVCITI
jgi:hypothetical protein